MTAKRCGVGQAQQRQRHADVVVEVAARGQALAGLREDRGDHLLGGGLAVAAGHADQRAGELLAPGARGALERRLRVRHHDLRQRQRLGGADHGAGGAGLRRRRRRSLRRRSSVPASATNSSPRVRARESLTTSVKLASAPLQCAAAGAREFRQRALHDCILASCAATTAWSLNTRRSWPTIW